MKKNIVYSTDPDFVQDQPNTSMESVPPEKQQIIIRRDRRHRRGKIVTLVEGFIGPESELDQLGKTLKRRCGAGGSTKGGIILIQGDFARQIQTYLQNLGMKVKISGG